MSKQLAKNSNVVGSDAMIQVIERAALNPDVDIDKMERLLDMQERIFSKNAEMEYNRAMSEVQKETPRIKREAENSQTISKYAKLEDINKQLTPIYTAHGFALSFGTDNSDKEGWVRTTCKVSHTAGHSRDFFVDLPIDDQGAKGSVNKTKVHGAGSTMSYSRRYLTVLIFNISLTDEDNDGNTGYNLIDAIQIHNSVLRDNLSSVLIIKESLSLEEYSSAKEAWYELSEDEQRGLWLAPTKGGIFTTKERTQMKSSEWSAAE